MARPEYAVRLIINSKRINRVIIDQHYKKKHAYSINDQLILELVKDLDGEHFIIEEEKGEFQYFIVEQLYKNNKWYRLFLMLCKSENYLGVINAFRIAGRLK